MKDIFRYMGIPEKHADEKLRMVTEEIHREITASSTPKHILTELDTPEYFSSESLRKHLEGCEKFYLFAATLGVGADFVIRKYLKTDILKGAVAQAAATFIIEDYCDKVTAPLEADGLFLKPRFSPGYGDFSLERQSEILALLNAEKRLGITLTESYMMLPTKSVTAVIGLCRHKACSSKCMNCDNIYCSFRKED